MKRILLLALMAAMLALWGGCVDMPDYGTEDTAPHEDNRSRIMDSDPTPTHNEGSGAY
jgi:hypothetical protein